MWILLKEIDFAGDDGREREEEAQVALKYYYMRLLIRINHAMLIQFPGR